MKQISDKKSNRMIINNTKEVLKKNSALIKQELDIEIPKDILNMDNYDFYVFITDVLYPTINESGLVNTDIADVVCKLKACIKAYSHYYREPKTL